MPKDFSHQDLRGRSFRNQDLTNADFSYADIRGVNFKGAILKRASFAHAKGGVTKKSFAVYLLMILILSALTGFLMVLCNVGMAFIIERVLEEFKVKIEVNIIIYTLLISIAYVLTLAFFIRKGTYSLWNINVLTAGILVGVIVIVLAGTFALAGIGVLALALALGFGFAFAGVGAGVGALGLAYAEIGCLALAGAGIGVGLGILSGAIDEAFAGVSGGATTIQLILSTYVAYRINKEDEQFETYRKFGLSLSSLFGTNFDGADLTDANFTNANLKYCRFGKETIILRTCFKYTENLKFARLTGIILENKAVRELLVTGNGKNQPFRELNLKGAYLVGADLSSADFHEADLIGATLENADLRNANLSRIQALGVEFRGADFTGACLESWNIDATTQLDGAKADYVYLLSDKQERRPASGNFGEGEFAKLFNEVLATVDFIFRNGIDWQAFMVSFDNLREKIRIESDNDDISIQSITNKGDGVFVVKVNVPPHTDKPEFHSDFTKEYESNLRLIEAKYHAQLEFKEKEIAIYREKSIEFREIIGTLAQKPVQIYNQPKAEVDMGDHSFSAGDVSNAVITVGDGNTITQNSTVSAPSPDEIKLKELLAKLQQVIEKSEAAPEDKHDALEEVKRTDCSG
ncbi:MAG: pentapeptide repeat-containing protein [Desulfobacteraceae bacterium]|nr:pentapeptide repeat-containing protein [Desulfobacteraceae bacterium]